MIQAFVVDASVVVDQLVGRGSSLVTGPDMVALAPSVLPYEVTNVLRKLWSGRGVSDAQSLDTVRLLKRLPILYWSWESIAERVWEHRGNLTTTDAGYVAVAELAGATLITKDRKLAAAPGIRCPVEVLL